MASIGNFFTLQFNQCKRRKLRGSSNESTSKQAKNAQKQEEEVKQPIHFKRAKGLRHLKQGRGKVSEIHRVFVKGSVWVKLKLLYAKYGSKNHLKLKRVLRKDRKTWLLCKAMTPAKWSV